MSAESTTHLKWLRHCQYTAQSYCHYDTSNKHKAAADHMKLLQRANEMLGEEREAWKAKAERLQRDLNDAKRQWENWHDIAIENEIDAADYHKAIDDALPKAISAHCWNVVDILREGIK